MRDAYLGYYPPSEDGFKRLWQYGTVVLDTNILLNLYRVSQPTRDEVFEVLRKLGGRLWLPYQVGLEFHQRRLTVVSEQHAVYRSLRDLLQRTQENAERVLGGLRKDSVVNVESLRQAFRSGLAGIQRNLDNAESRHPLTLRQAIKSDPVLDTLTDLFTGRTGQPRTPENQEKLIQEAHQRIKDRIPPGYADADKVDGGVGDVLLWRELLDWATEQENPVLLVTDDQKEDWYRKEGSTVVGPRPELVAEMRDKAGVDFYLYTLYLYTLRSFLQHARSYLLAEVSERALDEVRQVRREQEYRSKEQEYRLREQILARERQLARLAAEREDLEQELANARTIAEQMDISSLRGAELRASIREVQQKRFYVIEQLSELGEVPGDEDDSPAAQDIRHRFEQLFSEKRELDRVVLDLRLRLDSQMHERDSVLGRLRDIEGRIADRNLALARLQEDIARLRALVDMQGLDAIELDRAVIE